MTAERLPGLRGRSSERALLDRLLEDARGGHSAVLVIRGEAGVGKTALLRHAAEQASGFRVAQIAGVESEMELAYAGLHQLCAPMLDRLDVLPEPQQVALAGRAGPRARRSSRPLPRGAGHARPDVRHRRGAAAAVCRRTTSSGSTTPPRRCSSSSRAGCWRSRWRSCSPCASRAASTGCRGPAGAARCEGSTRRRARVARDGHPGPDRRARA